MDHIVLLKVKKETPQEQVVQMVEACKSLCCISGVVSVTCGPTFTHERAQVCMLSFFKNTKEKKSDHPMVYVTWY